MITKAKAADGKAINRITADTGVFSQEEVTCVSEIWQEYLQKGSQISEYYFIVFKDDQGVKGYACYGPHSLTQGTYDLYWVAVDPHAKRNGVGRKLMAEVEKEVGKLGGRLLIVETSGLEKYAATRAFYEGIGYIREATIHDFYAQGDDLIIYTHEL